MATKTARSSYEDCRLVLEDNLSRTLVFGHDAGCNSGRFTLVEYLNSPGFVDECGTCGDWTLDRKVLLSMEQLCRIEVGQKVERESGTCSELRDNPERRQGLEFVVPFKNPLQFFLCGTDTKVV